MKTLVACTRCNSKGNLKAYAHIHGGVCFACGGTGTKEVKVKSESQIKREAAKRAEKEAYHQAVRAENDRKSAKAIEIYANHPYMVRLQGNPMAHVDAVARELAEKDGIWNTL